MTGKRSTKNFEQVNKIGDEKINYKCQDRIRGEEEGAAARAGGASAPPPKPGSLF